MKKIYLSLLILLGLGFQLPAQDVAGGCDGIRYITETFTEVEVSTVLFGENINSEGQLQALYMDVYQPVGDTLSQRPVILWGFGGGFVGGSRADMETTCQEFARRGFVTAAFDYRLYSLLQGIPDSLGTMDMIVKAMHDMKAAIRHLRQDAATDNLYRIDPDRILAAGVSAGGITSLHAAYLDEDDEIPTDFMDVLEDNGGIEGNSGDAENLLYSSAIQFVINLSGALYKKEWIDADEAPLLSIHGTADEIVPYAHGFLAVNFGFVFYFNSVDGSGVLHPVLEAQGMPNLHIAVPGGMHEDTYTDPAFESYRTMFTVDGGLLIYDFLCPDIPIVVINSLQEQALEELSLYPNPAGEVLNIGISASLGEYDAILYDLLGRQVETWTNLSGNWQLKHQNWPTGYYVLKLQGANWQTSQPVSW